MAGLVNGRVLVMCASRGRPEKLERMLASVERTSTLADVAVYLDEDQEGDYANVRGRYRAFIGPRIGPCRSLDRLVKEMPGYEAYGAATDDCTFETQGWDDWVLKTAGEFKSGIGLIAPDSDQGKPRMDFPWATARWIEAAGSFTVLGTYQAYWDVGLQLLGEATQITFATPGEFRIWHESLEVADRHDNDATKIGVMMFYLYHIHDDARILCVWAAHDRLALIDKLKRAIAEGTP